MLIDYYCFACNTKVTSEISNHRIKCPKCHTVNDFWTSKISIGYLRHLVKYFFYFFEIRGVRSAYIKK